MRKALGNEPQAAPVSRRAVFAGAGTVGALAAAAAVLPRSAALAPVAQQPLASAVGAEGGYQVTEHVLRYYQTARV